MACSQCAPEGLPTGGRLHDRHFAIRLDITEATRIDKVTLDGEDVTMQCDEAIEGEDGLVVLYPQPLTICYCRNLRQVVKRGNVKVYLKEAVSA